MDGVKALLLDKDGTFVHFDRTWGPAAGEVMRTLAGADRAALRRLEAVSHYLPGEERFLPSSPLVAGSSLHYGPLWAQALGREADQDFFTHVDHLFRTAGMRYLTPIGTPRSVLEQLSGAGLRLAVVTNDAEANARQQIEALGLRPLVETVVGYDSGFGSKPDPGMIRAVGARFGLPGAAMAVVGDSAHDLAAAKGAGAAFILVRTGPAPVESLLDAADLVLSSIDDLPGHFGAA